MSKDINDIIKSVQQSNKDLYNEKDIINFIFQKISMDIAEIKKILISAQKRLDSIDAKIQEFEIIMDAAEILEAQMDIQDDEEEEDTYNSQWNPYNDEDYEGEDFDKYDEEN